MWCYEGIKFMYMWNKSPLLDIFANIFSHSVVCHLILVEASFTEIFILVKCSLSLIAFKHYSFGILSKSQC